MRLRSVFLTIFLAALLTSKAQVQFSGWLASFNTFALNKKFSLHFDGQLRSTDQWRGVQTILLRPGLNFHVSSQVVLTAGYTYVAARRTVGSISSLLPEHRVWQQAVVNHKLKRIAVTHRLRFEERFLSRAKVVNNDLDTDGFNQAFRLRYFLRNLIPFKGGKTFTKGWFAALQNEVFLNTGNKTAVNGKTFDQNRAYGALGYRLPNKLDLEAGYMNQYTNTAASFTNNHIIQLAVYKRL